MDRSSDHPRWVLVPTPLRIAAILVGLQGLQWLAYHAVVRLPSPFDSSLVPLAVGFVTLAAAVGILRAATWGRAVGIVATTLWLCWLVVDVAWTLGHWSDVSGALVAPALVWGLSLVMDLFILDQLVRRWPRLSAMPDATGGPVRTAVMLAVVLGAGLGVAWLMRTDQPAQLATVEALGPVRDGGRIEMPRSGFALTVPADWRVEIASPERDVRSADPGEAWEALRATSPERRHTCSVYVAVAEAASRGSSGMSGRGGGTRGGETKVRWVDGGHTLQMPDPATRIGEVGGRNVLMSDTGQTIVDQDASAVDIVYALHCGGESLGPLEAISGTLRELPLS